MKLVVDTNIVFSTILNSSSDLGRILIHQARYFEFYSCDFLKEEISNHRSKIKKLTGIKDQELDELVQLATGNIVFINENLIPNKDWQFAMALLKKLDLKDAPFVALTHPLKAHLWTGDKKLVKGLLAQGFDKIITTGILIDKLNG